MPTKNYPCPCCGYKVFDEEPYGSYDICPVCFWECDNVQMDDIDYAGGANHVSLRQAQKNYLEFGASEKRFLKNVREPHEDEERDPDWKPFSE
ncbi:MAG TPA: CPCC family cysteine-rich protein [Chloroflexia bacterium]|nr:CPCC family cysteine-rich protein [Chloroflexia bacterium]